MPGMCNAFGLTQKHALSAAVLITDHTGLRTACGIPRADFFNQQLWGEVMISLTQKTRRLGLSMVVAALFATAPAAQAAVNATVASEGGAAAAAVPTPAVLLFATPALLGFVGVARRKHSAGLAG